VLPGISVPPVDVPGAKTLTGHQLVPDVIAGPDFAEIDVGGPCSGASGKNECERRNKIFHGLNNADVMAAFPFYFEVRQIRMVLKSNRCTSSPARKA
jgi:hypothetical protein